MKRTRAIAFGLGSFLLLFSGTALAADTDGDGVNDPFDNRLILANPDQRDTNGSLSVDTP